ncbi:MAG: O-methyltransferase [Acholeplasmatales bacterium]|nr:O-methyltransferase [Acholeplasmatales bacterium]
MVEISDEERNVLLNLKFDDYVETMRDYAKEHNVPIIQDEGLAFLKAIVKLYKPKRILEIGCAIGYSSSMMSIYSDAEVYTIERDPIMYEQACKNIKALGLENKVHIIFKDALEITNELDGLDFDMIFIDAAKGQYTKFFQKFTTQLKDKGIVVTDNMLFHGFLDAEIHSRNLRQLVGKLKKYHEFLLTNPDYDTSIYNLGDGMALSIKK